MRSPSTNRPDSPLRMIEGNPKARPGRRQRHDPEKQVALYVIDFRPDLFECLKRTRSAGHASKIARIFGKGR